MSRHEITLNNFRSDVFFVMLDTMYPDWAMIVYPFRTKTELWDMLMDPMNPSP